MDARIPAGAARRAMVGALVLALGWAACFTPRAARADEEAVQRALLERQQQSDAFALQLRQFQQTLQAPPSQRSALEALHLQQRQRLDTLNESQRAELRAPPAQSAAGAVWGPRLETHAQLLERERRRELDRLTP